MAEEPEDFKKLAEGSFGGLWSYMLSAPWMFVSTTHSARTNIYSNCKIIAANGPLVHITPPPIYEYPLSYQNFTKTSKHTI